jgi:hypothetical protein
MKISFRLLALATFLFLSLVGRAQVTYTNPTSTGSLALGSSVYTAVQTFTGFSSISSMSWTLTNSGGSTATATFNAYIAEWNGATAAAGTLTAFQAGGASTGAIASGASTSLTFTDSLPALNPSLTYALVLSYASGDTTFGVRSSFTPGGAFFGSGGVGYASTSAALGAGTFQSYLEGTGIVDGAVTTGAAYTMSVTTAVSPVPEPRAAAAGLAALFVAALVGRRVWQRRKAAAAPLAA